ncbi:MAG: hypothetical protein HF314_17825, partial [Ignavibacteria bacterium]|nr:hypothetical protein [Ignavibacteria bacterium]MCU7504947.1 hypothetical protein [Ignavibacteria bacterium]
MRRGYLCAMLVLICFLLLSGYSRAQVSILANGSLGGIVWNDENSNGVMDEGEKGIPEVNVNVYIDGTETPDNSTKTDKDGKYSFNLNTSVAWFMEFTLPSGMTFSSADAVSDDAIDSDADPITGKTPSYQPAKGENNMTICAGMHALAVYGSISGHVWDDLNGNGNREAGEPGIPGLTVRLKVQGNQDLTGETNGDGVYTISNVTAGENYHLEFPLKTNDYSFSPKNASGVAEENDSDVDPDGGNKGKTADFNFTSGENKVSVDAGMYIQQQNPNPQINGILWLDADGNGFQLGESSEPGVGGWTVQLLNSSRDVVNSTETNDDLGKGVIGRYSFTSLTPGTYYVRFVNPGNYTFTIKNATNDNRDSDVNPANGESDVVEILSTTNEEHIDAGVNLVKTNNGKISGVLWEDNGDGIRQNNEAGLGGCIVELLNAANGSVYKQASTASTGELGTYSFTDIDYGTYILMFYKPGTHLFSPKDQTDNQPNPDERDSDVDPNTGKTAEITVNSGTEITHVDAGAYLVQVDDGRISGKLWDDTDKDGIQESNEAGLGGYRVELLYAGTQNVYMHTSTGQTGDYGFSSIAYGNYIVKFYKPETYLFSPKDQTDNQPNPDERDSDVDPNSGQTAELTVSSNVEIAHIDAGAYLKPEPENGKISGILWQDNGDGIQQGGELGLGGYTVELHYSVGGGLYKSTSTSTSQGQGEKGTYRFDGIAYGNYYIKFSKPEAYTFSPEDQGGNDEKDSDVDPATGQTMQITVSSNGEITHIDAGAYQVQEPENGKISGILWDDSHNMDGIQAGTSDEPGLGGYTVELRNASHQMVKQVRTNSSGGSGTIGTYEFTDVLPGTYFIWFSKPDHYLFSPRNAENNDNTDSDVNPASGETDAIALRANEDIQHVDAGVYNNYAGKGSIGDLIWFDSDEDGIQDSYEAGVAGVKVVLYKYNQGQATFLAQTITNIHGQYVFNNLEAGSYRIWFGLDGFDNYTLRNAGNDETKDSEADMSGWSSTITLGIDETNMDVDAGLVKREILKNAGIGDFVWKDSDQDGIQDANEPGIPNVMVELYKWEGNTPLMNDITDSKGKYLFENLMPGSYYVKFILPEGFKFTKMNQDGVNLDSDADPATGKTDKITLQGEDVFNIDAGMYGSDCMPVSIGDLVWNDLDQNGLQNNNEPGLANIIVNLYKTGNTSVFRTTTTDLKGAYHFAGILPGSYYVQFILPKEFAFTLLNRGNDDALDSDADMSSGMTGAYTLSSGEVMNTVDAGIFKGQCLLSTLGDMVWIDG